MESEKRTRLDFRPDFPQGKPWLETHYSLATFKLEINFYSKFNSQGNWEVVDLKDCCHCCASLVEAKLCPERKPKKRELLLGSSKSEEKIIKFEESCCDKRVVYAALKAEKKLFGKK